MPSLFFADLVRETSSSVGTGPFVLSGAVPGHRSFAGVVPPDTPFYYAIVGVSQPDAWETGTGSIDAAGALLRTMVAASSAGGQRVDFGAGLKTVALTVGAGWFADQQNAAAAMVTAMAGKQAISTSHGVVAAAVPGDMVTVQRAAGWVNLPLDRVATLGADGRFALNGPLGAPDGTAAGPALAFAEDSDTGWFRPAPDSAALATGGAERLRVTANGQLGIGVSSPAVGLHIRRGHVDTELVLEGAIPGFPALEPTVRLKASLPGISFGGGALMHNLSGSMTGVIKPAMGAQVLHMTDTGAFDFATAAAGAGNPVKRLTIAEGGTIQPGMDNDQDLGSAGLRFKTVFAATGVINTSDAREKAWRGALNPAELRAAARIGGEIGMYQWHSAIADKGSAGARVHVGVRAQAVWAIMADEGLVDPIGVDGTPGATPYAFLCWDRWPDGDRFGVRADELALFIAAAHEARIAALEGQAAAPGGVA